ncbi:coiled-coil domain-containing protein 112-like [Plakobranchus ocellatus]|uniref:Coiled-coil domain-containing protein 112-like n=1 Tax=Plakobranchus ocellatus TaxID=259542 RepID=A0AAV4B0K7_9GAST|nr:coiled-coil domain-containing protein 112-like [Plakobranchus ocellatus]
MGDKLLVLAIIRLSQRRHHSSSSPQLALQNPPLQAFDEDGATALKRKNELAKKAETLREIHKLNVQIQAMEREKQTHIFSKRSDFRSDFSPLEEEEVKLMEERKTEKVKVKQQLEKINYMVKRLHRELRDVKPTPEFVEKLKNIMEEIEAAINSFKQQQRLKYEELLISEKAMSQEVQQLEIKFESWSQKAKEEVVSTRPISAKPLASARDVTKDLPPEVAAFDKFVHQSGGHRGGWDEYDHGTFLRIRNMYKGRIVFLDYVKQKLPTHTETEIREHETWYQEYLFLNENKKCAIKKWREKREEEKEDAITQVQDELEAEKQKTKSQESTEEAVREKAVRAKQINAWRVQKELDKAMQEEKKARDELERKKQQEEQRIKQLETKRLVEEFRQQRQLEENMLEMIEEDRKRAEEERKREIIAKEIGRFHVRDMQRLSEKIEKEREKEEIKKEKERKLEALKSQVQVQVSRDPSRLLRPTSGWKERLKDKKPSGGGQIIHMPHRAIPSWRQGLM